MADYIDRLVLSVIGEADVRRLRQEIDKKKAALLADLAAMQAAGATQQQITAATRAHAAALAQLQSQYKQAERAAGGAAGGFAGAARALQGLAFLADDIQYVDFSKGGMGLRPVLNNLAQIHPALFAVGLGLDQAIRHWDFLRREIGEDTTIVQNIEHMAGAINKFVEGQKESIKASKEAAEGWAHLGAVPGEGATDRAKAMKSTVESLPGGGAEIIGNLKEIVEGSVLEEGLTGRDFTKEVDARMEEVGKILKKAQGGDAASIDRLFRALGPKGEGLRKRYEGRLGAEATEDEARENEANYRKYKDAQKKAMEEFEKNQETPESRAAFDEEADRVYKDKIKDATARVPERLKDQVDATMLGQKGRKGDLDVDALLKERLKDELMKRGFNAVEAEGAAGATVDAERKTMNARMAKAAEQMGAGVRRNAAIMDVPSYIDSVQTQGVDLQKQGIDIQKKALDELVEIKRKLAPGRFA